MLASLGAVLDDAEWQDWLASHERWGVLAVNNIESAHPPIARPRS